MTLFTFSQVHFVGALSTWSVAHGYSDSAGMITGTCHTAHTLHSSHSTFYIIPDTSAMIALPQTRSCIRLNCIGLLRSNDWVIVMAISSQVLVRGEFRKEMEFPLRVSIIKMIFFLNFF